VADQHRNGERRISRRPFGEQNPILVLKRFEAADPAADNDAEPIAANSLQIDAAVVEGHSRRAHGKLREAIGAAEVLWIFEIAFRLEPADFARDLAVVLAGVESLDPTNPADTVL